MAPSSIMLNSHAPALRPEMELHAFVRGREAQALVEGLGFPAALRSFAYSSSPSAREARRMPFVAVAGPFSSIGVNSRTAQRLRPPRGMLSELHASPRNDFAR
jgi:hypothetical protein